MKKVFVILMVCLMSMTVFGQERTGERPSGRPGRPQPIGHGKGAKEWMVQKREQRRAYVMQAMSLTETEEAAFKAIYDDYNKKISVSKREMNKAMRALNDSLSDEEFEKNLDIVDMQELEQAKITDEFYKAMKKALPIKKVYLYYKADKEFNKLMMKEMQHDRKKVEK